MTSVVKDEKHFLVTQKHVGIMAPTFHDLPGSSVSWSFVDNALPLIICILSTLNEHLLHAKYQAGWTPGYKGG